MIDVEVVVIDVNEIMYLVNVIFYFFYCNLIYLDVMYCEIR